MGVKNILIFNEDDRERKLLGELLRAEDFNVFETPRVLEAIHILKKEDIGMVLASHRLARVESAELKELVEKIRPGLSIVFVGPYANQTIPFTEEGFKQFLQDALRTEQSLNLKVEEFKEFLFSITDRLLQIFEVNDRFFFNNDHLVANLAVKIAMKMGLDKETVDTIRFAALVKDIGKVVIKNKIFEENKRFDSSEFMPIKSHPLNTVQILRDIKFPWNADSIISQHHESYDGSGYPAGLKGRQIAVGARIIHIADSYVAMTTDRPYRQALSVGDATHEILKKAGSQFDPEIVEVFMEVVREEPAISDCKRSILMLEREPSLSALIRLGINAGEMEVLHASTSFDAVRTLRQKTPDLVIADVEMLDTTNFANFYNTLQSNPAVRGKPFIFILPDNEYPRAFKGRNNKYIIRPVDINELSTAIRNTLNGDMPPVEKKTEASRGLSGALEDFGLADIIQILNLGLKTAKVDLVSAGQVGTIYIQHGKVIHASMGELSGRDAFMEMIRWDKGTFQIYHGVTTETVNVKMDTMHLLLDSARMADEQARLKSLN